MKLRARWEYGHVLGFVLQLFGFCALVLSALIETPKDQLAQREVTTGDPADRRRIA